MKPKQLILSLLAFVTALELIGCGKVDENRGDVGTDQADSTAAENSSFAETVALSEESGVVEENSEAEESSAADESIPQDSSLDENETLSLADEENPVNYVDFTADEIALFESFPEKIYSCEYDTAAKFLKSVLGDGANLTELGEYMNALEKIYLKDRFDYNNGVSVLGEKFYSVTFDYDRDDKTVYTVGFNKNPDLNTSEDGDPSASECKDSYDRLYTLLQEKYGEPTAKFTPESNGYLGGLWKDTPCGEIWLVWGEDIFGTTQSDCILSFSRSGISGLS